MSDGFDSRLAGSDQVVLAQLGPSAGNRTAVDRAISVQFAVALRFFVGGIATEGTNVLQACAAALESVIARSSSFASTEARKIGARSFDFRRKPFFRANRFFVVQIDHEIIGAVEDAGQNHF